MQKKNNINELNTHELKHHIYGGLDVRSWHDSYKNSSYIYIGNIHLKLSEGDLICMLSQFGEIIDFVLHRDFHTGESLGYAFCQYEDIKSCILAVDNLSLYTFQLSNNEQCGPLQLDHVLNYQTKLTLQELVQRKNTIFPQKFL